MKKILKDYLLPIVFIIPVIILKLNPYSTNALIAQNVINVKGSAFNIIPFSTIKEYVINHGSYNPSIIIKFFIFNLITYMPFAVSLDLSKIKNNNGLNYLIIFLTPIIIELLQVIFEVGLLDIDSIIINILGMLITYKILKNIKRNVKY